MAHDAADLAAPRRVPGGADGAERSADAPGTPPDGRPSTDAAPEMLPLPRAVARDVDAGSVLQLLLVSAVVSVLATRVYLELTGFPRISPGGLHLAHLLWGGLLMLAALVILLTMLGKRVKRLAAAVGGVGFGLFVDEIGKFVTADNDYFFRPAIALIYLVFISLFMLFRAIERRSLSADELLANAADMLREIVLGGATRGEVVRARRLLDRSGFQGPLVDGLQAAIAGAVRAPERPSALLGAAARAARLYDRLVAWPWFKRVMLVVVLGRAVGELLTALVLGWSTLLSGELSVERAGPLTSLVSLGLVLLGMARLPRSRLAAYRWFERSVLISIFFTQVILFWQDQLAALGGLAWDLVLLWALRFLIRQEETRLLLRQQPSSQATLSSQTL